VNDDGEIDFPEAEKYFLSVVDGIVGWTDIMTTALNECETFATSRVIY
jgi:hypothetical protein